MNYQELKDDDDRAEILRKSKGTVSIDRLDWVCQPLDEWFSECDDCWLEFKAKEFGAYYKHLDIEHVHVRGRTFRVYGDER